MSLESPDNILNVRNAVLKVSRVEMNTLSANTVSSNLTVAGDATMSSNLTVAGDATMSSNLDVKGVLNHTQTANVAQITSNSNVVMEYKLSTRDYETKEPRIALTANSDRGYVASASSSHINFPPNYAFDNVDSTFYHTDGTQYVTATGAYQGSNTLNGVNGEWLSLQLPNKIDLSSVHIYPRTSLTSQSADSITIVGSNDGSSWTTLTSVTGLTYTDSTATIINVNSNTGYKYFAIIAQKVLGTNGGTGSGIGHWALTTLELYGTGDNGTANVPTGTDVVLHTTPNVPKTDFSNVYYDGQDYTSMPATVADKSGNGVTGTPSGGVGFDTTYKAFTFDGVDDKITATLTNPAGDWVHSVSMWWRQDSSPSTGWNYIYQIGAITVNAGVLFAFHSDGFLAASSYSSDQVRYDFVPVIGKWYHFSVVYKGGNYNQQSIDIYIDGSNVGGYDNDTSNIPLSLGANTTLTLGAATSGTSLVHGSMANFRLYNNALSADEIWELYAYQKEYFGVSPDVVTLKAGRLGIGTSEPRAVLDVRGDIIGRGIRFNNKYVKVSVSSANSSTTNTTAATVPYTPIVCSAPNQVICEVNFEWQTVGSAVDNFLVTLNENGAGELDNNQPQYNTSRVTRFPRTLIGNVDNPGDSLTFTLNHKLNGADDVNYIYNPRFLIYQILI